MENSLLLQETHSKYQITSLEGADQHGTCGQVTEIVLCMSDCLYLPNVDS